MMVVNDIEEGFFDLRETERALAEPVKPGAVFDLRGRFLPKSAAGRLKLPVLTEGRFVRGYTDRITKAMRQSVVSGGCRDRAYAAPVFRWWFSFEESGKDDSLVGVVGLPLDADPELLTILHENPAVVMQTELILSARVFQQ